MYHVHYRTGSTMLIMVQTSTIQVAIHVHPHPTHTLVDWPSLSEYWWSNCLCWWSCYTVEEYKNSASRVRQPTTDHSGGTMDNMGTWNIAQTEPYFFSQGFYLSFMLLPDSCKLCFELANLRNQKKHLPVLELYTSNIHYMSLSV